MVGLGFLGGVEVWWWNKFGVLVWSYFDAPLRVVDESVMCGAEQDAVLEVGGTAL